MQWGFSADGPASRYRKRLQSAKGAIEMDGDGHVGATAQSKQQLLWIFAVDALASLDEIGPSHDGNNPAILPEKLQPSIPAVENQQPG